MTAKTKPTKHEDQQMQLKKTRAPPRKWNRTREGAQKEVAGTLEAGAVERGGENQKEPQQRPWTCRTDVQAAATPACPPRARATARGVPATHRHPGSRAFLQAAPEAHQVTGRLRKSSSHDLPKPGSQRGSSQGHFLCKGPEDVPDRDETS